MERQPTPCNQGARTVRLLIVRVEGVSAPIVLVNEDHQAIPNAAIEI
ncbi:hypothetical protein X729_06360 [Mesorhizobium sp. L103C131B0]|nr:hypothetical protein X729_06360 [Mesorhizobium sp. L103C131B0]